MGCPHLGTSPGNTARDGGTQNQAADALEQRAVAPYDASWISWITIAALVRVCSDRRGRGPPHRCAQRHDRYQPGARHEVRIIEPRRDRAASVR